MRASLHSAGLPGGRCLLLARDLARFARGSETDCLRLAQRLYDGQHPATNPAVVELADAASFDDLRNACAAHGIAVEGVDERPIVAGDEHSAG